MANQHLQWFLPLSEAAFAEWGRPTEPMPVLERWGDDWHAKPESHRVRSSGSRRGWHVSALLESYKHLQIAPLGFLESELTFLPATDVPEVLACLDRVGRALEVEYSEIYPKIETKYKVFDDEAPPSFIEFVKALTAVVQEASTSSQGLLYLQVTG